MEEIVLIELHYLPSLEFWSCIGNAKEVIFDIHEHFVKQTYRNRCYILTSNKVAALTVPVKEGNKKVKYKDIQIDENQKWINTHWRTIMSGYGKAPFFEFYAPFFEKVLLKKHKYLLDLNIDMLSLCLSLLKLDIKIKYTDEYNKEVNEGLKDLRNVIHPKKNYTENNFYKVKSYNQIFGNNFVSNLSIIDLLFCEGGNAKQILHNSTYT